MVRVDVKLCPECLVGLINGVPYVDKHGNNIPLKGIRLTRVDYKVCDHYVNGKHIPKPVVLHLMNCRNCDRSHWIKLRDGVRPTCPSCHSARLIEIEGER